MKRFSTLLLVATVGTPMASAAPVHRKQEVEITGVPQTQLTKPAPAPAGDKKATGPIISLEEFVGKKTDKIQNITNQQIDLMKRMRDLAPEDDPEKPGFHFRLAELYADKQRYYSFQARSLDEKIFQASKDARRKAQLEREQKQHDADSEKWLLEAVKEYIAAANYKKFKSMDEVLFKLAFLLQAVKKEEEARTFFYRLIKDYPNSRFVPEAYLSFGEYFFGNNNMDQALKFYERVEQFPKSPVFGYAVYKKGWCWINLGDFKKALAIFVDVIKISQEGRGGDPRQNKALEREAKKDVVRAFAKTPGANADKAWEFFARVGGDFAPKMMEILGELYWEQGMFTDSTRVYRKIIALNRNPPSARICEWQNKIVRNTLSSSSKVDQVKELGLLSQAYELVVKMKSAKADVVTECKNSFHDTSKELAQIWHKEAQKTKNRDTYSIVRHVYKLYLEHFSKEKGAIDMAFFYGEVLWMTEMWKEAAEVYTKVVEMDPKGKYVQACAKESSDCAPLAAVLAWKNALNIDDTGAGPDKGKDDGSNKQKPIPANQEKMVAAFDTYLKYAPESAMVVKIKYRKARIYYDHNHFDKAVPLYADIVERHTKDELAIYSANLLLDSLNIMGRTKEVIAWVQKFTAMPDLMKDPEFQKQMFTLRIDSLVAEGKRHEREGNFKECGASMLAAAESVPDAPEHATRLYDAGTCFQNARLIGRAVAARQQLIDMHPKDPLAQKALYNIASNYYQLAYYTRAADFYEQFATKYPGEKQAVLALGNAYQFRLGLGDFDKAATDLDNFVKFYGARKPQQAADVHFQMSEIYERQNKKDELARHLTQYIAKWGNKGTPDKEILAHFKLGEMAWKRSCPKEGPNGACIEIKRVTATGKQKAIYDINKKIKDKRKKIREVRTQCGPPTHAQITVFDRRREYVREALKHFDAVLKLWKIEQRKISAAGMPYAAYAASGAAFYKAEGAYEDFLRVKFPEGMDFQTPSQYDSKAKAAAKKKKSEESVKKFTKYITEKTKLATALAGPSSDKKGLYDHVVDMKVAHWVVAASSRIGQVYSNFVDQLYTAEIPRDLKEQDEWGNRPREIYCDKLVDTAEPIETKAVQAYGFCLKAAMQQSWFNEWSGLCETELNQMQPSEFPLAAEAKPEPGYVSTLMTPASVVPELPPQETAILQAKAK